MKWVRGDFLEPTESSPADPDLEAVLNSDSESGSGWLRRRDRAGSMYYVRRDDEEMMSQYQGLEMEAHFYPAKTSLKMHDTETER